MRKGKSYSGNFDDVMNFDGRGGAIQTLSLHATRPVNKWKQRQLLRSQVIDEHRKDFRERTREYSRTDLLAAPRVVRLAFGRTLAHYRERAGYSQQELAEIVGIDRSYPSLLERGLRAPTAGLIVALPLALRINPAEFFEAFLDTLRAKSTATLTFKPRY